MILRLQSEEELQLLQSRIKAKSTSIKGHMNGLERGTLLKEEIQAKAREQVALAAQEGAKTRQDESSETELVRAVRWYLSNHPSVAWCERVNAGGSRKHGSYVKYGFAGISDFIGMLKTGQFLAIECKTKDGRLSQDQAAFLARVEMWKGVSGVVRSIEDLKALLPAEL